MTVVRSGRRADRVWRSACVDGLPTGAPDRDDPDELEEVSESRSAVPEVNTGTPAPVERLGISGRVAPTKPRDTLATRSNRTSTPVYGASIISPLPT